MCPDEPVVDDLVASPDIEGIEILALVAEGGMSLVYKARQKQLDRIVAVKVLAHMPASGVAGIKRFQKEAKLTSSLEHPNIVKIVSFGVSKNSQPYLVAEYLEGVSLDQELKQNGRLTLQKFKDVFLPVLSALEHAHQAALIHRDIKPGNIMLCSSAIGEQVVKLVDFGIAKVFDEGTVETANLTKSGTLLGSPAYMSPEQCQGKPLDGRSDLYSLACVMYEMLSGEPPFSGDTVLDVMHQNSVAPPPTVSEFVGKIDIGKNLAKTILWALAKDPNQRPQTASEFAEKLNEALELLRLDEVPRLKTSGASLLLSPKFGRRQLVLGIVIVSMLVPVIWFCSFRLQMNRQEEMRFTQDLPPSSPGPETIMQLSEAVSIRTRNMGKDSKWSSTSKPADVEKCKSLFLRAARLAEERREPQYQMLAIVCLLEIYEYTREEHELRQQLKEARKVLREFPALYQKHTQVDSLIFLKWADVLIAASERLQQWGDVEFFAGKFYRIAIAESRNTSNDDYRSALNSIRSRYVKALRKNGKFAEAQNLEQIVQN